MKKGWTYKKLGEVCEVISGQSPNGKSYNNEGIGTPFYQGKKEFNTKYIGNPTTWTLEEIKIAVKDDILMSVRAPVGDINFATQRICIGRGLAAIRASRILNKEFLFYFLLFEKKNIIGKEGAVFPSINRKEIMDISISIPPLSEQQRIVERLDVAFAHIDELKAKAEKQLNEARQLFQAELTESMKPKKGWEEKKLGEVAKITHGKNQKEVISEDGQYPIYGSGGNIMGYANGYLCEAGTTILGRKGSINNPIFIEECFWNVDTAFGISAKEGNDSKYIYYFIKGIDWLKKNTGTTLPSLTQQVVGNVPMGIPPLPTQQRIVAHLDALSENVRKYEEIQRKTLAECDALKQAILREVFE